MIAETAEELREMIVSATPVSAFWPGDIIRTVERVCALECGSIAGSRRFSNIARARHIAVGLLMERGRLSYPRVGRMLNRNHSTIMYSHRRFKELCRSDDAFAALVDLVREELA